MDPVQAPESTAPLIHLLISWLYIYIVSLFTSYASHLSILFTFSLLIFLSFPLRIDPLHFQAGGHKRQLNLAFFSCFSLLWLPCIADVDITFSSCGYFFLLLLLLLLLLLSPFFSSPNLSHRRLDVYHTSTHGVVLVRI